MAPKRMMSALMLIAIQLVISTCAQPDVPPLPTQKQLTPNYFNRTINVCTSDWQPAVICENLKPEQYSGFETELFRNIVGRMGLTADDLNWTCTSWDDMEAKLFNNECDVAPAGLSSTYYYNQPVYLAQPSMRTGFSIMVQKDSSGTDIWYFFSAMASNVWIALFSTGIIVGIIIWLFEVVMHTKDLDSASLLEIMTMSLGKQVVSRDFVLSSLPANLTAWFWSFLVFVTMLLYGANLTANLTISQLHNDIRSVYDLPGKTVATADYYVDILRRRYNIAATPFPWNNSTDAHKMVDALKSGLVKAVVIDDITLQSMDAQDCSTMIVGDLFELNDIGTAFSLNVRANYSSFIDAYNQALQEAMLDGIVQELIERFISQEATCKSAGATNNASQVVWDQVAGLWVLLGIALGVGLFCVVLAIVLVKCVSPKIIKSDWVRTWCSCFLLGNKVFRNTTLQRLTTGPDTENEVSVKAGVVSGSDEEIIHSNSYNQQEEGMYRV